MSKNNGSNGNGLVEVSPLAPTLEIPNGAPMPHFDLENPDLTWMDLFPENFFSMDGLQGIMDSEQAHSLMLTVSDCRVEYVFDPAKGDSTGEWKPVLFFEETATKLILNKTRAVAVADICGSHLLRDWSGLGQVTIRPGIKDGHAQIILEQARRNGKSGKGGAAVEDITKDLFAD